nr:hypothetical protein GCM10020092_076770 [Actinoplanes digitatis]
MVVAAFVAPFLLEATTRFVATAAALPGVRLAVITSEPAERLPPVLKERLDGHWRVDDAFDPRQLAEAVTGLGRQMGRVERLVGALEQLQVPLAHVREALGIEGMDVRTALNVRDKARMKSVLHAAGVPCARHQLVTNPGEALSFADAVGFPLVAKPPTARARRRRTGWTTRPRCGAGSRRSRPARTRPACWRSSWSARSTPSTASRSAGRRCGRRCPTICHRRWRCSATPGSSGRCCCRGR